MKICDFFVFAVSSQKIKKQHQILILLLASQKGVEPPTFRLGGERSIQLSY